MKKREPTLLCEVFRTPNGIVTVTTDVGTGSGTRLCGVKLTASGSVKIAEFRLNAGAVEAINEDFAMVEEECSNG